MYTREDGKVDGRCKCSVYLMASQRFGLYLKAKVKRLSASMKKPTWKRKVHGVSSLDKEL